MDWVALLAEVSFPILVTFYLLTRIESKLDQLTLSIQSLTQQVKYQNMSFHNISRENVTETGDIS